MRNALQHPDITRIERTGYPRTTYYNDEPTRECSICGVTISEEQSAFKLCEDCEIKAWERFSYLLLNEFTQSEREFVDACVEGHSLTEIEKIKPLPAIY